MPQNEPLLRLTCFVGALLLMALWETIAPRREHTCNKPARWANNLGLTLLNTLVVKVLLALGAVAVAALCAERGWGLFNNVAWPVWLSGILAVVLLDLAIYLQHVMFHAVPAFWRLHMVHHADLDFDATTGIRFHTFEIVLSMVWKIAVVVVLGAPPVAVLVFEVLLNATSMFNHGNVRMPIWLDRIIRLFVVTPDMHRVHHSVLPNETNSNFGFNLPWWDYLLGTYRSQPAAGHRDMTIGLSQFRDVRVERLPRMLAMPFLEVPGEYPINRRACATEMDQVPTKDAASASKGEAR